MKKLCQKINFLWRLFGTGISFVFFGIGALALSLFVFPSIFIFITDGEKKKRAIRKTISFAFKCFMYFMHYLGLLNFKKENISALKTDKSCLLIANHPTLIDVVAIIAYTPGASCIVKKELWENPFLKGVVSAAGYIPNSDPNKILEGCKRSIESGDVLVVFPEGTRTKPGQALEFQRGAAHIALAIGCPVRCVEVTCEPLTLSKGVPWYKIPAKRVDFTVIVKDKLMTQDLIEQGTPRPLAARKLIRLFLNQYCTAV